MAAGSGGAAPRGAGPGAGGRALALGRFQPFHNGHLGMLSRALSAHGEVVVGVAASQFSYTERDPFTAGERIEMIRRSLRGAGEDASRCMQIPLENQPDMAVWAAYLRSRLPPFGTVISGNPYAAMLLADSGVRVEAPRMEDRGRLAGSRVRAMMARGDPSWRALVPPEAASFVDEVGGEGRIMTIARSGERPAGY